MRWGRRAWVTPVCFASRPARLIRAGPTAGEAWPPQPELYRKLTAELQEGLSARPDRPQIGRLHPFGLWRLGGNELSMIESEKTVIDLGWGGGQ